MREEVDEPFVLDAADAVSDASGLEQPQRFPDAFQTERFSGVSGAVESVLARVLISGDMGLHGESGFVTCDVAGYDVAALKLFH